MSNKLKIAIDKFKSRKIKEHECVYDQHETIFTHSAVTPMMVPAAKVRMCSCGNYKKEVTAVGCQQISFGVTEEEIFAKSKLLNKPTVLTSS